MLDGCFLFALRRIGFSIDVKGFHILLFIGKVSCKGPIFKLSFLAVSVGNSEHHSLLKGFRLDFLLWDWDLQRPGF